MGTPGKATLTHVRWRVGQKVTAPAVDDKANFALKNYLAEFFEVAPRKVNILRGANGREKTVEIVGKTEEQLKRVMESIP